MRNVRVSRNLARSVLLALTLALPVSAQTEVTGLEGTISYTENRPDGTRCSYGDTERLGPSGGTFSNFFLCDDIRNPVTGFITGGTRVDGQVAIARIPATNVFTITASMKWTDVTAGGDIVTPGGGVTAVAKVEGNDFCAISSSTLATATIICNAYTYPVGALTYLRIADFEFKSNRSHRVMIGIYATATLVPSKLTLGPAVSLRGSRLTAYKGSTTLTNPTFQDVRWSAVPLTESGGNWLTAAPTSGTLRPGETTAITLTGDPRVVVPAGHTADRCPSSTGLPGRLAVTAEGGAGTIPVNLIVNNVVASAIKPGVEFRHAPGDWQDLTKDVLLGTGDEISVDPDGLVTLRFPDGSNVDAKPLSQFKIEAFCQAGGIIQTQILQTIGDLTARVVSRTQGIRGDFVIRSPVAVASVRGTVFSLSYDPSSGASVVKVEEGTVDVTPTNTAFPVIALQAGQQVQVAPSIVSPISPLGTSIGTAITSAAAVNAASFAGPLVRGSIATLFGTNLASTTASAEVLPLPTTLAGAQLRAGNILAPLIYASPTQINFQVPFETPLTGTIPIVVTTGGTTRASISTVVNEYAPGVFAYFRPSGYIDPIIVHGATNTLVSAENPAIPGETLIIYGTGVGNLTNPPASGAASSGSVLSRATVTPAVTLGTTPVQVRFAGLTPGFVGLIQLNIDLPPSLPTGTRLPLVIAFGAVESRPVMLSVLSGSPVPSIRVNTSTLNFGSVAAGQTKDLPISIANTGTAALVVSAVTPATGFSLIGAASFTVPPGGVQNVTVRFEPTVGSSSGTLTIVSNDPGSPALVSLVGARL
jgi:uncharacterized protein (TIGR03437 family)